MDVSCVNRSEIILGVIVAVLSLECLVGIGVAAIMRRRGMRIGVL